MRLQDSILKLDVPNEDFLRRRHIILADESKKVHFYTNLNKPGWLKPLFDSGAFVCANNPEPVPSVEHPDAYSFPYWIELSYVERIAQVLTEDNIVEWNTILSIIKQTIKHRKKDGSRIENPRTDNTIYYLVSLLPEDKLRAFDLSKIESLLQSTGTFFAFDFMRELFPRFLRISYKEGALFCLRLAFEKKENEANGYPKYLPLFETHDVKYCLGQIKGEIHQVCGIDGFNVLMRLVKETKDDPDYLLPDTFEEHDRQNQYRDDYTDTLLFFTLDYYLSLTTEEAQKVTTELLNSGDDIFKRMAYWMTDKRYDEVTDALWKYESNPANDTNCYPELYRLFKNNCEKFTDEQIDKCVDWINGLHATDDVERKKKELIIAHHKKRIAIAFQELGNAKMDLLIDALTEIDPAPIEHPGYSSYTTIMVGTRANLPQYTINGLSIPEIGEMYARIELEQSNDFFHRPIEGLSSDFRDIVKSNIVEYTTNCDAIANVPIEMQSVWLWEIIQSLGDDTHIDNVDSVLRVLLMTISNEEFWGKYKSENKSLGRHHRYITDILMLLYKVMEGNGYKVSKGTLDSIFPILYKIDTETSFEYSNGWDSSFQTFVNNLKFKVYKNLIMACYWEFRLTDGDSANQWDSSLREKLEEHLSSGREEPMVFHALGILYAYLSYIAPEWYERNYPTIFNSDNSINKKAALYGFFLDRHLARRDIFDFLYGNGTLHYVLSNPQDYDSTIIKHIVMNMLYAVGMDILDESVVNVVLNTKDERIYRNIIDFSHALKERGGDHKKVIRHLWSMIYTICVNSSEGCHKKLIGNSLVLIEHFDTIDSDMEKWLILAIQNSSQHINYHIFKQFKRFIDLSPDSIGKVVVELIKAAEYSYFPELPQLVEKLYDTGNKDLANSICEEAAKKQIYSLKDIYEKNNIV